MSTPLGYGSSHWALCVAYAAGCLPRPPGRCRRASRGTWVVAGHRPPQGTRTPPHLCSPPGCSPGHPGHRPGCCRRDSVRGPCPAGHREAIHSAPRALTSLGAERPEEPRGRCRERRSRWPRWREWVAAFLGAKSRRPVSGDDGRASRAGLLARTIADEGSPVQGSTTEVAPAAARAVVVGRGRLVD